LRARQPLWETLLEAACAVFIIGTLIYVGFIVAANMGIDTAIH
jgi:hypothetical protein